MRRLRHAPVLALAAAITLTLTAGAVPAGAAVPAEPEGAVQAAAATSPAGLNWLDDQESSDHQWSQADAVAQAQRFDLISALPSTYADYVPAMKAANPQLQLFVYMNGSMATHREAKAFPESWFLHDADGNRITNRWHLYLMDVANPGWVADRAATCAAQLAQSGYDGCFLDNLGAGTWYPGMVSGQPVDPATGRQYSAAAWLPRAAAIAAGVRATTGRPVMSNGLIDGTAFFDSVAPSSVLLDASDIALAETFVRTARQGIEDYPSVAAWKQDVDMVAAAAARGQQIAVMTKVWRGGTQQQVDDWHTFALGSFLLGADLDAHFEFSSSTRAPIWDGDSMMPQLAGLGAPTGPYTALDSGVYQRTFAGGLVLVNPGDASVAVALGGTYSDALTGTSFSGSVIVRPHTGQFLLT